MFNLQPSRVLCIISGFSENFHNVCFEGYFMFACFKQTFSTHPAACNHVRLMLLCFCILLDNNKRKEEIISNFCTPATSFCVWMVQQILDSPLGWLMSCLVWQERGRRISFDWQQEHGALRSAATSNTIDLEELAATVPQTQTLRLLQLDQLKEEVWVEAKNPEQEINDIVIHHI